MAISLSWPLGFSRQARFRPQLAHRRSQPRTTCYHGAATARWSATQMPIVKPSWRRTLHRTSRSLTKLHSEEVLTSTSTGAHTKPLDPVLDPALHKPIDPELCSLHAASSPQRTAAETLSLPASCLFALLGRIVTCTAAGPGSPPTGAPRPDDPIIATSRWGRLVYQPPTALRWGYHGVQVPRAVHPQAQTTPVDGGERKFD